MSNGLQVAEGVKPGASSPTDRQLRYLRVLAERTGTTFTSPSSRVQASREIERLQRLRRAPRVERDERREVENREAEGQPAYAPAVRAEEITGHGSSARWRHTPPSPDDPTEPRATPPPRVGRRTEIARYRVSSGERVLYRQQIRGCLRVVDRPASSQGRAYLVERRLEHDGEGALAALVTDYLAQARELDEVPMASGALHREHEHAAYDHDLTP